MFKSSDFKLLHAFPHYIINCDKKKHYLQKFVNSVVISGTYPQNQILKNCFYPFAFYQKWQPLLSSKKSSQKWQPLLLFLKILSEVAAIADTSSRCDCLCNRFLWLSPRPISIYQLNTLLCLHLKPIYLVVFKGSY